MQPVASADSASVSGSVSHLSLQTVATNESLYRSAATNSIIPTFEELSKQMWPIQPFIPLFRDARETSELQSVYPYANLAEVAHIATLESKTMRPIDSQLYHVWEALRYRLHAKQFDRYLTEEDSLCLLWQYLSSFNAFIDEQLFGYKMVRYPVKPVLIIAYGIISRYRNDTSLKSGLPGLVLASLYIASIRVGGGFEANPAHISAQIRRIKNENLRDDIRNLSLVAHYLPDMIAAQMDLEPSNITKVAWKPILLLGEHISVALVKRKGADYIKTILQIGAAKNFDMKICLSDDVICPPEWFVNIMSNGYECTYNPKPC